MKTFKSFFLFFVIAGFACFEANGQVTIGADIEPRKGALLDIKQTDGNNGAATVTSGGLLLPRVSLSYLTNLAPLVPSPTGTDLADHKGLTVYNLSTTAPFKPGLYVWNGIKWITAGEKYFYMPSCNIPVTSTGTKNINLYDEYAKQFAKAGTDPWVSSNASINFIPSPESTTLYARTDLDYVITYYDTNVFSGVSVNANGLMSYTVNTLDITPATYFNIVFVVK
ncbi:MAG: hypothetical protein LBQ65_01515 [Tannerellaceae bacterium]|jgi:hypothetical protein|nr:hypothetical protein [Tannerellaceae bacterium]